MSKKLVAYFSASGVTKRLATNLAEVANADLFEIVPEQPYTVNDLNWNNPKSRSSIEMKEDRSIRPAVASKVKDMDAYDVVFVGFPIWWYVAPTIVNTFLEQYDFAGKIVVPFATSGGSGMGNANAELAPSCPGAMLVQGRVFPGFGKGQLKSWVDGLGL